MKLTLHFLAAVFAIVSLQAGNPYPPEVAAWKESDITAMKKAGADIKQKLLEAVKSGAKDFVVPPGNYFFEGKGPAITIEKASSMVIEAKGAVFYFDPAQQGLKIAHSKDVTVRGLTMDYYPLPFSQGRVTAIDSQDKSLTLELDSGYPVPDPAVWVKRVGAIKALFFEPKGERLREVEMDWISALEPLGGGKFRVRLKESSIFKPGATVTVGDMLALPMRDRPIAYSNDDSSGITLEDFTIHAAGNFAIYEEPGDGGNIYRRCRVIRRPGTDRLMACNADVFHVNTGSKGPLVEECEFSYAGDDLINIHSLYGLATEQKSPRTFVMINHYARPVVAGRRLQIFDFETFSLLGEPVVKSVKTLPGTEDDARAFTKTLWDAGKHVRAFKAPITYLEIEMDADLKVPPYAIVGIDESGGKGTIIRDCHLHDNYTRAMLLRGSDVLVENNRIERCGMSALVIGAERQWLEGPTSHRVTVRGNTFTDCSFQMNLRKNASNAFGVISVTTLEENLESRTQTYARDIVIEDNTFIHTALAAIVMIGAENCKITGNKFVGPVLRESTKPPKLMVQPSYAITLTNVAGIELKDNVFSEPGQYYKGPLSVGRWVTGTDDGRPLTSAD